MSNKLFVGNLSFNTTENDLQDAFSAHGTVIEANLMLDRSTGRPRGFGFVTRGEGTPDIFVHMETLRRFGFTELRPGQIVQVRWGHGSKGCMAAELRPDGPPSNLTQQH